jgi:hypothetical protein
MRRLEPFCRSWGEEAFRAMLSQNAAFCGHPHKVATQGRQVKNRRVT